jgi:hypothetical protein
MRTSRSCRAAAGVSVAVALALGLTVAPAKIAAAADAPPEAVELKKSGNEKMIDSDFVGALADYRRALDLAPDDLALYYNIGRAEGLLGRHPQALDALETFDRRAPPELKAKIAKFAELLADTRQHVGWLSVTCDVAGANVLLGAVVLGQAPLQRVPVEAGANSLQIGAEGYRDDVRPTVRIDGGKELTVACRLLPKSTSGTFVADATPTGAKIAVDGVFSGTSHVELPLGAGPHKVIAQRDGYETAQVPFVLRAGDVKRLVLPLEKKTVPITARWWFWTGVGVVVVAGVAIAVAAVSERSADKGSIEPRQLGAPIRF